jgi:hypothetical protein
MARWTLVTFERGEGHKVLADTKWKNECFPSSLRGVVQLVLLMQSVSGYSI